MIVICTGCQARFRVADEKIGPRGAKVRCTRCQNVFVVRRATAEPAPAPAPNIELDLTPGPARSAPAKDPFAGASASVIPFPGAAPGRSGGPSTDPFVAAGLDNFGGGEAAGDDPFARAAVGLGADVAAATPPPAVADDPFAAVARDPFAGGHTGSQSLPVTDLSQLLGGAASAAPPPRPTPPPARSPAPPPPAPPPVASAPAAAPEDLALEERSGSMPGPLAAAPAAFADPADALAESAGFFAVPGSAAPGEFDPGPGMPGEESLSLATEPTPMPRPGPSAGPPPLPLDRSELGFSALEEAWAGEPAAPAAAAPPAAPAAAAAEEPSPPVPALLTPAPAVEAPPAHRVRTAALNALALVALLVLALAIRLVLRGDVPLGPAALRPSTLLRSLGGAAPAGPFEVADVKSGVYPQSSGGAVLFVRGVVVCRPPAPVGGVQVKAELIRDGQVLARGEVRAGAVPSPEEVYRATDRAALDALSAELRGRAPKRIAAGDRLGFLITLGEAPSDLSGTSVRLQAVEAPR